MQLKISYIRRIGSNNPIALNAAAGIIAQIGRPLASLITMPFLLGHLGQAGLGLWIIALSIIGVVGTLNSGLSITLVTSVARVSGSPTESDDVDTVATAGSVVAFAAALTASAICLPAIQFINWKYLLNLTTNVKNTEIREMLQVLTLVMAVGFVATVPRQIMMGRMHGYVAHYLDIAGVVFGSGALIAGLVTHQPLWMLALAFTAPSVVLFLLGGLIYLRMQHISAFSIQHIHRPTIALLAMDSLRMVAYHTAYSISSQTDLLLVGTLINTQASATYGVAQRIFFLPILVATAINQAQWPSMARSQSDADWARVDRNLRQMLLIVPATCAFVSAAIALAYPNLVKLWLGVALQTDQTLLIGMVIWVPLAVAVNIYDTGLRAKNESAYLAKSMLIMAIVNIIASIVMINIVGYAGALWGTIIGYTLALLLPYARRHHNARALRLLNKMPS